MTNPTPLNTEEELEQKLLADKSFQHILKFAPESQRELMTFELAKYIKTLLGTHVREAETNAVAWAIGVIDDIHIGTAGLDPDRNFKTMKNTIRDRYKAETGIDPAPNYPVKATLTSDKQEK